MKPAIQALNEYINTPCLPAGQLALAKAIHEATNESARLNKTQELFLFEVLIYFASQRQGTFMDGITIATWVNSCH